MKTTTLLILLVLGILAAPLGTEAQPTRKMPRIGVLMPGLPPRNPGDVLAGIGLDRFRQGLRELGYVEDQTIALEVRWNEYQREPWPELAADLVRLRVDIIVAGTNGAPRAAPTGTTPL